MAVSIYDRNVLAKLSDCHAGESVLDIPMSDISPQRIAIVVVQFRHILKVRWALSHQSSFAKKRHFSLRVETVLPSEIVYICHELISGDANERVLDFSSDILGHCDDALLAPAFMVVIAASILGAEAIVFELRLLRGLSYVVADTSLVIALLLLSRMRAGEYFTPFVAMVGRLAESYARARG